ncbi:hypothetical protein KUF71_003375 [Frankliniella fusca]|uniref:RNA-directed DNA polymerase n=1 Tax=Frankliniella fusca TaxID=407009 RepID=A0AAE1GTL2_9NEOP|nr:hypothetical protein KUF71_003375 [Frankliniella fusca]
MVIREKSNGDLRICLDPEQLKKAIVRKRYVIPTSDELACKVKDQAIFTVLDLKWGKHMHIADLLSRNCLDDPVQDDPEMVEVVHEVTKYIPLNHNLRLALIRETENDAGLSAVMQYYQNGWPNFKKQVVAEAQQYWQVRNDLFVEDNFVILNDRIVVPPLLRNLLLTKLHSAHLGIEKTKARARQSVYWPGMSKDITILTKKCRTCERHSAVSSTVARLQPHLNQSIKIKHTNRDIS